MRPERIKRKGASTPPENTVIHTISRRQENMMEMQVNVMNDIARTFNTCVCGVPPIPEKGKYVRSLYTIEVYEHYTDRCS